MQITFNDNQKTSLFLMTDVRLKKKSKYFKKIFNYILMLKFFLVEKQQYKKLNLFLKEKSSTVFSTKSPFILYFICFSFSSINTFLSVTNAKGRLEFSFSAGLLNFKGKSKKSRFQVLKIFFKELYQLKLSRFKNKPVSLHLNNVGSYKRFILRKIKKKLFIKIVKNYQPYSYNGCRRKKKFRK